MRIAEGPTAIDAATQRRHFGFRLRLVDKLQPIGGERTGPRTLWYLENVDGPQCPISNLWRMMQFCETYRDQPKLAALVRELSWSHKLAIMSRCKRDEGREF